MQEEQKDIKQNIINNVESKIEQILNDGIRQDTVDYLYKLVDIHKDIKEECYREEKIEIMRYRNYNEYGEENYGRRGVPGTGRGRYRDSYGRRGVPGTGRGRYRGEEILDDMSYHYGNYSDGNENYGTDEETMKSFKYMLKSFKDYYKHLKNEASSQEEVQMLEDTAREISEM